MIKWIARYTAYLAFAAAVPVFWVMFAFVVFGFLPFPGDPACHFEPQGCPERPMIVQAIGVICMFASVPLTVLAFVLFRKVVRRAVGLPKSEGFQNDR